MKTLHIIVTLSIASNLSLHSMNIVPRKLTLNSTQTNTAKRYLNINKTKVKEFFDMNNINNAASLSSIIAASTTANPLYLLPIIPQMLHRTSAYLHMQKELPTQFECDLAFLLENKSTICNQLEAINQINQKINVLKEKADAPQLERLNLLTEHKNKISELEKNRNTEELKLIEETAPLFKTYEVNVSKRIQEYESKLNQQKPIIKVDFSCFMINGLSSIPMLGLSVCALGDVIGLEENFTTFGALSIIFNTGIICKNVNSSDNKLDRAREEHTNLKHALEMLKIYQAHAEAKNNQHNQTNE